MNKFYRAANVIVVTTVDGVEHMYHFAKDLVVHGGKGSGVDALEGLREGSTVVVHYTVSGAEESAQEIDRFGDEGLKITEGVVTNIDRRRKDITIRFDNGKTETLRMTDRVAVESEKALQGSGGDAKIVVYYSDEAGRKVVHYFKKTT
jgi:Cu/Ag efflux protein CusF